MVRLNIRFRKNKIPSLTLPILCGCRLCLQKKAYFKIIGSCNKIYEKPKGVVNMKCLFDQIKQYQNHLINEKKSKATIEKYVRNITAFYTLLDGKELTK